MIFWKILSWIVNYIIRNVFGVKLRDYGCVLKVFKSDLVKDLGLYGEFYWFIFVFVYLEGVCII